MNIGLYFGSFNPIHHGHLIIANHILNYEGMDQVWFIVSPHNPLKETGSLLNEYHRLHLVQLSIEGATGLRASDFEFKLPRPSYTIDTLTYLKEEYPKHTFSVIMGSDSFQNIHKWKNAPVLLKEYAILVYLRPGHQEIALQGRENIRVVQAPQFDISSSFIRETIRKGKSIRFLVPDVVQKEIEMNGYYKHK